MHEEPPMQISFSMVPSGSSTTFQLQLLQIVALWCMLQINSSIAQFSMGHSQKNLVHRFVERCPQDTQLQNTLKTPRWWEYFWSVFPTEATFGENKFIIYSSKCDFSAQPSQLLALSSRRHHHADHYGNHIYIHRQVWVGQDAHFFLQATRVWAYKEMPEWVLSLWIILVTGQKVFTYKDSHLQVLLQVTSLDLKRRSLKDVEGIKWPQHADWK